MAAKMLVRYRTKMLKRPEEIQDVSFSVASFFRDFVTVPGFISFSVTRFFSARPVPG